MNPQMLQLLRESRGLSSAQLAKTIGVSPATMSKIEHGLAPVADDRLTRIAQALDYPPDAFAWNDQVYGFGSAVFYHRKQQSLPQSTLRSIQAQVNLTRMRLTRLSQSVEIDTRFKVPVLDATEVGGPAAAARAVRAMWALPMGPIRNIAATLERAGIVIIRADLESQKISAISIPPLDGAPHMMFVNASQPADRERFTLAHELAHLVLHGDAIAPETAEKEADEFAAEFLMPASEIRAQLKGISLQRAAQLKLIWRVSMGALIRRARDLGVIDEARYRSLNVQISQRGWRTVEPAPIERDVPTVMRDLVKVHLDDHEYSVSELASVAGMHPHEFAARYDIDVATPKRTHLRAL
ncbi:Zn-dependent peptidase ImmA (M78 family)/transcriptional regulator with XRE-family HTH domain [Microbacterium trichothecenolyticum]|uniref:XRE family transcriptional regulator n=1 Tax=Microbacterium trichothecenolyticum TaxID=69370 RepID=UPI00285E08BA|nr:XRE family transcriptional regulator [Microbacterium trichothecenolyticum]MDR7184575.1 Zn-dependent peptidase ImmA (M78 family)/transcriptional regulator with XRE-family HTH domain [Microbacterium trichothecenolyticum]